MTKEKFIEQILPIFCDRMNALSHDRKESLSSLCHISGIKDDLVQTMVRSIPRTDKLYSLGEGLGVSIDYLLGRTDVKEVASSVSSPLSNLERELLEKFSHLTDPVAQGKVIAFIEGLLAAPTVAIPPDTPEAKTKAG